MPETTVVDLVERCSSLERENAALQRLRREVSGDLAMERALRRLAEKRLRSCRNALAFAALLASVEFLVVIGVILWLGGSL